MLVFFFSSFFLISFFIFNWEALSMGYFYVIIFYLFFNIIFEGDGLFCIGGLTNTLFWPIGEF